MESKSKPTFEDSWSDFGAFTLPSDSVDISNPDAIYRLLEVAPLCLVFGLGVAPAVDPNLGATFMTDLVKMRVEIALETGFVMPGVWLKDNHELPDDEYRILIYGKAVDSGEISNDRSQNTSAILRKLGESVKRHAPDLLSFEHVCQMLDMLEESAPVTVSIARDTFSIPELRHLLAKILESGLSIRNLSTILRMAAEGAKVTSAYTTSIEAALQDTTFRTQLQPAKLYQS